MKQQVRRQWLGRKVGEHCTPSEWEGQGTAIHMMMTCHQPHHPPPHPQPHTLTHPCARPFLLQTTASGSPSWVSLPTTWSSTSRRPTHQVGGWAGRTGRLVGWLGRMCLFSWAVCMGGPFIEPASRKQARKQARKQESTLGRLIASLTTLPCSALLQA